MKQLKGWGDDEIKELLKILNKALKKTKRSDKKSIKKVKKSIKSVKKIKKSVKKSLKKAIKKSKQKGKGIEKKMISEHFNIKPIWQEEEEEMKEVLPIEEMYLSKPFPSKIKITSAKPIQKGDLVNIADISYLPDDSIPIKKRMLEKRPMQMTLLDL